MTNVQERGFVNILSSQCNGLISLLARKDSLSLAGVKNALHFYLQDFRETNASHGQSTGNKGFAGCP